MGGEITTVINQQASIDGEPAGGGDPIPIGGLVVTDDSGVAVFVVATDPATCELRPASAVEVRPTEGLLLRVVRGTAVCDRAGTNSSATFAAPGSLIEVGDSTVVIEATEDAAMVGNVRGEVAVAPAEPGATAAPQQDYVQLERNQGTEVVEGEAPELPSLYRPTPAAATAVSRMNADTTDAEETEDTSTTAGPATTPPPTASTAGTG